MTHKKKHRQHRHVVLNERRGLNVGGVVVPYWPSYWGGVSGYGHTQPTNEGSSNDNSNSSGSDSGGSDGGGSL